jgi:hypothetical protein
MKRVDIQHDRGDWLPLFDRSSSRRYAIEGNLESLEDLRLLHSQSGPWAVNQLLRKCENLKTFHWVLRDDDWQEWESEGKPMIRGDTIDTDLVCGVSKLTTLHFETVTRGLDPDLFGLFRKVTCLPALQKLNALAIDLMRLLGEGRLARLDRRWRLAKMLPPNLQDLTLIERWTPIDMADFKVNRLAEEHDEMLRNLLRDFRTEFRTYMPHLTTVRIQAISALKIASKRLRNLDEIGHLVSGFERIGIDFLWEYRDQASDQWPEPSVREWEALNNPYKYG